LIVEATRVARSSRLTQGTPHHDPPDVRERCAVLALLALLTLQLSLSVQRHSVTCDEPAYFAAGVSHWHTGKFDLYRVNPPLPRMLAVLPLLPLRLPVDYRNWSTFPAARAEFTIGDQFAVGAGDLFVELIRLARLSSVLWALVGAMLIYRASRALFGPAGGITSLALWCFEPNVIAHGSLMTQDMAATVCGFAAMLVFGRALSQPSLGRACAAGVMLGVALLTKLTHLFLLPLLPLCWWLERRRAAEKEPPARALLRASVLVVTCLLVINLGYLFRGTGQRLGSLPFASRSFSGAQNWNTADSGNRFRGRLLGALPLPVPADFVQGMDVQRVDFEKGMRSYLHGVWRTRGWWHYYLVGFALKVPLGTLALMLAGLVLGLRARRWLWVLPPLTYVALVSSQTGFNHHFRYTLPAFPYLLLLAGACGEWAARAWRAAPRRWAPAAAVGLAGLSAIASAAWVQPHALSYFNALGGGPDRGDRYLVDSNIDWGQDLSSLKEWLDRHPAARPLGLAYFGTVDPHDYGIDYQLPPAAVNAFPVLDPLSPVRHEGPRPGWYAVSVNFTRGLTFGARDASGRKRRIGPTHYTYFASARPVATAGHSIRIYCLDSDEANRIRGVMRLPPGRWPEVPANLCEGAR
jgi:4-amino-4-deoxy-L-arabinose transferase-like glycosyltransferase